MSSRLLPFLEKACDRYGATALSILTATLAAIVASASLYSLWRMGLSLHHDEWVGRGLYPGLAMGYGLDLYEPATGPHVTLYGFGTALFYAPAALAATPAQAIWFAYLLNVVGFALPVAYLLNRLLSPAFPDPKLRYPAVAGSVLLVLAIFSVEPTTEGILRIHADLPALFFLLGGLCLFDLHLRRNDKLFLYLTAVSLSMSVWAKLPTLTATGFPILYFLLEREFKKAALFIPILGASFFLTFALFALFHGWDDTVFVLFKHISGGTWSIRNHLFDGENATFSKMSYFEAIPLLFRFLIMYLAEYWYVTLATLASLAVFFFRKTNADADHILKNTPLIYALTLPPGLAALAHFGSVENSLLFANASGLLLLFLAVLRLLSVKLEPRVFLLFLWTSSLLLTLPFLRLARSGQDSLAHSPHNQAFEYLKKGNSDVYFGWYPIAHLMHSGKNYSCIETPTWVGMTKPDAIDFSIEHFPPGAKYLATGPTGYGSAVLRNYLGELEEVPAPPELSSWRLFQPVAPPSP